MCGICGFSGSEALIEDARACIGAMCDVIVHRGPDEDGYYVDSGIVLGMRRLKIIDLLSGSQPIFNEDKTVVVVFNGEIYNFKEIRHQLVQKGHEFQTNTDTEVIAHLYEDCGEDFVTHLNGMFGIALWDAAKKKLILARDRMGEKPLYYSFMDKKIIFGSEIKSILCHPGADRSISHEALYHYFSFNYIPAPLSVYKNIKKLLPGEMLIYQNGVIEKKRFWTPRLAPNLVTGEEEFKSLLYDKLYQAVKLRMISDVPLGAFLSGGIDSSIMVCLMSQVSSSPVKTFSIGLENEERSELPFARAVAERCGTDHYELIARPDAVGLIDKISWYFDEPFGDSSAIPTFLVSELTRRHVTVAISGDGGDELFAGYERYQRIIKRSEFYRKWKFLPDFVTKFSSGFVGDSLPFGFKGKAFLQSLKYDNYSFFSVGTSEELKRHLFSKKILKDMQDKDSFSVAEALRTDAALIDQCMLFDMNSYLPDDIMTKVDRMSMANSLETRAPFLDHSFVEFALTIPSSLKLKNEISKYILKQTFRKDLPESVFAHKKTGFSIPLSDWFRNELRPLLFDTLTKAAIEKTGILSYPFVEKVLSQHMAGTRDHQRLIWMILMFQLWHRNWAEKDHPKVAEALRRRKIR